jgi:phosphomannomutase
MNLYCADLRNKIETRLNAQNESAALSGLHIVVDDGNGSGGFFASEVLSKLGADTSGSLFLEPDGCFPNHQPNPENKEAMKAVSRATAQCGADLGLIFDTDVDRMSAVLPDGRAINRDKIIAMISAVLRRIAPAAPWSPIQSPRQADRIS